MTTPAPASLPVPRYHDLDAVRAFALVLGVVFHAALSFVPFMAGWAVVDVSTSSVAAAFAVLSHSFRLELFFLIAGFFARLALHRRGTGPFVRARLVRLGVPFAVGWFVLHPLIVSAWAMGGMSLRGEVDVGAGLWAGLRSLGELPRGLFVESHLWFLYYLGMLTAGVLGTRALLGGRFRTGVGVAVDRLAGAFVQRRWGLPVLMAVTAGLLWRMQGWGMDTPDRSLVPHGPVLGVYGMFFALGWALHRQPALLPRWARLGWGRAAVALVAVVVTLATARFQADPGHPWFMLLRGVFTVGYAITMWLLVVLAVGVFRAGCRRPRGWVRYVADSSYWMYLVHLPIVAWGQVAVAEWLWPWWIKWPLLCVGTVAFALISYDLCVRSTWVGWVLNGRRRERVLFRSRRLGPVPAASGA